MPPGWIETTALSGLPTGLTLTDLDNFGLIQGAGTVPKALLVPPGWIEATALSGLPTGLTVTVLDDFGLI